ncbi:N-terminal acetyltransferase [Tulasnella sp. 403]|nr:N-terminal acetyltransferase [Tulasnella sp. 403]
MSPAIYIEAKPSFYTPTQVDTYLSRIGLSQPLNPSLENLSKLIQHHITTFPFENTNVHYTAERHVDVTAEGVYNRLVIEKRGGSWCFGMNRLLWGMLLSLGYRAYPCLAGVNLSDSLDSVRLGQYSHLVLLVQLPPPCASTTTYLVDTGFGTGPVHPVPLEPDVQVPGHALPEVHRLHPLSETEWQLQVNLDAKWQPLPEGSWRTMYQLNTTEVDQSTFEGLSRVVEKREVGLLVDNVIAVLHIKPAATAVHDDAALGRLVLFRSKLSLRGSGDFHLVKEFVNEEERLNALKEHFGIQFDNDAIVHVRSSKGVLVKA